MSNKDIKQIVGLLKRMDERLSALESGRRPARQKKTPELSETEKVCQRVRKDLETRQLVRLTDYCSGVMLRWARRELRKDKNLRVIKDNGKTYVIKETAPKFVSLPVRGRVRRSSEGFSRRIDKVMAVLDTNKTLTSHKIGRMLHIGLSSANTLIDAIGKMKGYKVIRVGGHQQKFLSKEGIESELAKHQPYMRKKSGYNKFMADKLSFYQRQGGMNAHDAFMSAVADWNRVKGIPQPISKPFPAFKSVRAELQPILRGVLERLFRDGAVLDFRGISYTLDIGKESEYKVLVAEILSTEQGLRAYFGVPNGKLVWNGETLRFVQ